MDRMTSVMIVDDNPEVRDVLQELLSLRGFSVSTAQSGLSALLRIGLERPSCLVLDLKLEDISGFEIYRVLRADPDLRDLPVLFISGAYPDEEWVRRQLGSGPIHFLAKPVVEIDLVQAVSSLVA
jgi:CheY-like chemotaxis protein